MPLHRSTSLYSWRQLHIVPQLADCRTWKWQHAALGLQLLQLVTPSCWKDAACCADSCRQLPCGLWMSQLVTSRTGTVTVCYTHRLNSCYSKDLKCHSLLCSGLQLSQLAIQQTVTACYTKDSTVPAFTHWGLNPFACRSKQSLMLVGSWCVLY